MINRLQPLDGYKMRKTSRTRGDARSKFLKHAMHLPGALARFRQIAAYRFAIIRLEELRDEVYGAPADAGHVRLQETPWLTRVTAL